MSTTDFRVSTIIPCYNMAALLPRAIESAMHQTVRPCEVIVVDDGSTDDLMEVLPELCQRFPNLRVVQQSNRGNAGAKNTGIRAAQGNWLAFLDADDAWLPQRLEKQLALWRQYPQLAWIAGAYQRVKRSNDQAYTRCGGERVSATIRRAADGSYDALDLIAGDTSIWIGTMLARTDVVRELGGFCEQLRGCDDSDLWVRFALRHPQIGFVSEPVASYTVAQAGSMTGMATRRIEPSQFLHYQRLQALIDGSTGRPAQQLGQILLRKINGYFNGMLRTGNLRLARQFDQELRKRELPRPSWYRRGIARLPEPLWRAVLRGMKTLRGGTGLREERQLGHVST